MADSAIYQKRVSYQAILLGGFATLSTVLLLLGDLSTRQDIADRKAEDMQASLAQVIPARLHDNSLLENRITLPYEGRKIDVYRGTKEGQITSLAYQVSAYGYGGEITLIMGVDNHGTILGVRVLTHSETPGLGDKIEIEKGDWITGFNGLSLENTAPHLWAVKKDGGRFDQFSGATITPRGVVRAIRSGLDFFHKNEEQLTTPVSRAASEPEPTATPAAAIPRPEGASAHE